MPLRRRVRRGGADTDAAETGMVVFEQVSVVPMDSERVLFMFVLNGIGTVRNAHGYLPHIALRERVARGELIGPTIITSGPSFRNEHVASVAAAERFVADHVAQGYDFIKVYPTIAGGVDDEAVWEAMTRAANAAGIPFGGHVPTGLGLHRELTALVAAGLTPYQALETGTRNVAIFLNTEDRTGTVEVGKRADLLLVDANPLEDVANAQRITGVMLNGRWLPREQIEALLR